MRACRNNVGLPRLHPPLRWGRKGHQKKDVFFNTWVLLPMLSGSGTHRGRNSGVD
jgi:hypothetical protein